MPRIPRREFLRGSLATAASLAALPAPGLRALARSPGAPGDRMRFGLVTYLWGKDWDLPTLIAKCEQSKVLGVELRTTHAHGVEPALNAEERRAVKKRFADSPVELVGMGSNEAFHHPDAARLRQAIEATKAFVKLSHDCGGSGVKVKPNDLPRGVDRARTIEQIGKSLNLVGAYAADYGQEIRLEVHGQCSPLPIMKEIMDVAIHPNVGVCWNSNGADLEGEGLEHNFRLVEKRFGHTVHVRELDGKGYPYQKLADLLVKKDYEGWILLEARGKPADKVKALIQQRTTWARMVASARERI